MKGNQNTAIILANHRDYFDARNRPLFRQQQCTLFCMLIINKQEEQNWKLSLPSKHHTSSTISQNNQIVS